MFLTSVAYAMGQPPAAGAEGPGGGLMSFLPLVLMFVIFYFLLIRPQQKKQKEAREMLKNLKRGDRIMTGGGIYGRIESLTDELVNVEIASGVVITVNRNFVSGLADMKPAADKGEKKNDKKAVKAEEKKEDKQAETK
ncbi:preprotein translocase subunit YajC [Fundidesulfovibrio agrisoli]|uniref:preprotein translocase subunit YajC n=1 Tax=Fundidesulfovibrio agrisoli TaxID=2922717 RepID=UPI001FADA8DA|nr:preprotein translocase subunit YajC [Fundidesulfovibrio agrisoli]